MEEKLKPFVGKSSVLAESSADGGADVGQGETHGEALRANAIYDALLERREGWYQKYRQGKVAPEVVPEVGKRYKRQAVRLVEAARAPVDFLGSLEQKGYKESTVKGWEKRVDLATRVLQDKFGGEGVAIEEGALPAGVAEEKLPSEGIFDVPSLKRTEDDVVLKPPAAEIAPEATREEAGMALPIAETPVGEVVAETPPLLAPEELSTPKAPEVKVKRGWGILGKAFGPVVEFGKNLGKGLQGVGRQKAEEWKPVVVNAWNKIAHPEKEGLEWVVSFVSGVGVGVGASAVGVKMEISPATINLCKGVSGAILGAGGLGLRRLSESEKVSDWISRQEQSHSKIARIAGKVAARVVNEDTSRVMMGVGIGLVAETGMESFLRSIGKLGGWQAPQPEVTQAAPTSMPTQTPTTTELPTRTPPPTEAVVPTRPPIEGVQPPPAPPVEVIPPSGVAEIGAQAVGPTVAPEISQLSQVAQKGMEIISGSNPWRVSENIAQLIMKGSGAAVDKEVLTVVTDAIKDLSGWAERGELAKAGDLVKFNPSQLAEYLAVKIEQIARVRASGGELKVPVSAEDLDSLRKIVEFLKGIKGA